LRTVIEIPLIEPDAADCGVGFDQNSGNCWVGEPSQKREGLK